MDTENVTKAMDEALDEVDRQPDPWVVEAGRLALLRSEW